jgi:hypothetical protein
MANYFARKAGDINAVDVWATTPAGVAADVWSTFTASDVLHSNNFAITVNVSTTVGTVRNDNANSATNGGTFTLKPNQTLTANVFTGTVSSCLTFAEAGSTNVVGTINANSTNVSTSGIANSNSGTVLVTGNIVGGGGANATGITNSASGVINVTGSVLGSTGTAVRNSSSGTIVVTGPVEAGLGASGFGHGIFNASTGIVQVVGSVTASSNLPAISSTNASSVVRVSGSFIHAVNGQVPVSSNRILLNSTPLLSLTRYALNGTGTYVDMFTADNGLTQAAPADVRSGTVYADGALTGTCVIPAAASVAFGVAVDATTGTAALTPASVWDHLLSAITASSTIGKLLKDNVDATISSRSTATTEGIADAVWDEAMSGHTTSGTYGGRIVRSTSANNELSLNAQNHAAANVHQFQTAVIAAAAFNADVFTAFSVPELQEIHAIHGLKTGDTLTVTPTSRTAGAISQTIGGDGTTTTTVSRD